MRRLQLATRLAGQGMTMVPHQRDTWCHLLPPAGLTGCMTSGKIVTLLRSLLSSSLAGRITGHQRKGSFGCIHCIHQTASAKAGPPMAGNIDARS